MISAQRYKLVRTVASGGMAQVLEAVAQGLDGFERRVAIKRLLPRDLADEERRRLFAHEAGLGGRLHHGGIIQVFDYGVLDGAEFMAMEYVDGVDALRAVSHDLGRGGMPEGVALHVAGEVAHALAYLHGSRGAGSPASAAERIVHRDVSASNILLSWDGDVKLCDFGIAIAENQQDRRQARQISGTPAYMAPEQAQGKRLTTAADIYALGVTLGVLMGGKPLSGDHACQIRQLELSPDAAGLIVGCVAPDPAARPVASDVAARAGVLASRRLGRDGRGALREWLQPLRALEQRRRGLDDLMGLCLEPGRGARPTTTSIVKQQGRLSRGIAMLRKPLRRAADRL